MSQHGSQILATRGFTPIQILRYYYPNDINIVQSTNFGSRNPGAYPGTALREGSRGEDVRRMQLYLNRIAGNWWIRPFIQNPNGIFGGDTRELVMAFQRQFNLNPDGVIGPVTWYEITRIYVAARRMAELDSEGQRYSIGNTPPTEVLRLNSRGNAVVELQFLLNFIGQFYNDITFVIEDSVFRESTRDAVIAFQRRFNLTADGVVGPLTWNRLYEVYRRIRATTPQPHPPGGTPNIPAFAGTPLQIGTRSSDVSTMQTRLNAVARCNPSIETLVVDGVFGQRTQQAVREFQRIFGLPQNGIIDQNTWYRIVDESNLLQGVPCPAPPQPPPPPPPVWPPFPGVILREGMTGPSIRQVQERLNALGANPRLAEDGVFGPRTAAAVRAFQQQRGLNVDGIVGPITWNALFGTVAPPPPPQPVWPPFPGVILREGMTGPSIRQVQERLNVLGTNPRLAEDGIFGPRTAAAVRVFQQQRGLNADGIVDTITWNALFTNISRTLATLDTADTVQAMILSDPKPHVELQEPEFEVFVPSKPHRQSKNRDLIFFLILMLLLNEKNQGFY